ncbi:MAG TPA: hypothetical protein VFL93_10940 [Longimicrobiaceae bacterium]|nr:hypothetical protein [Longimicrobiaceae bacterium]
MRRGLRRTAPRCIAFVATGVLLTAAPLAAQAGTSDSGTFRVLVGGQQVGTEDFSIHQTGTGANAEIVATGHVQLQLPSGTVDLRPRLRTTGIEANPVSYEIAVGGTSPEKIVGTIGNGRFSARIVTPTGEKMREYLATSGATVLDEGIAHQYYFLARRVRDGRVPIIIPRENRQVMATVRNLGEEHVQIAGTTATLYHLVVQPAGGDQRDVWVDALGRVIRVEIPARGYTAVRTQVPA